MLTILWSAHSIYQFNNPKNHIKPAPVNEPVVVAETIPEPQAEEANETTANSPPEEIKDPTLDAPDEYLLSVQPELLPNGDVRLKIRSNIPGTVVVMAGVSLHGQADDDVWVGKNQRVRVSNGEGAVTFSTRDLPAGEYDAEAAFYPRWGFQDTVSRATGITREVNAVSSLTLAGSGESAAVVQFKENGQKWVMMNVAMGDPWHAADWVQRFGKYSELRVDRGNPEILKAYYFPKIDTTLIVNVLKKEISIWRLGKARS